jgi:glycosyltransferase involved in cell wall biosynthesis
MESMINHQPLISVIITCYNHGSFLQQAIESALTQNWPNKEVIIVDDGSTDHTRVVAKKYESIQYIYQENQGLSSARNTGAKNSSGDYIVFLDADDWLLSDSLESNYKELQQNTDAALVSGSYTQYYVEWDKLIAPGQKLPERDHYLHLLKKNYIAMHATVMYRRWVFDEFSFDTWLQACEDYDLYLSIARKYPIHHHNQKVAVYRLYRSSMSGNGYRMLTAALTVMQKHKPFCKTEEERIAWKEGVQFWKQYYGSELYHQVIDRMRHLGQAAKSHEWKALLSSHPFSFSKLIIKSSAFYMKQTLKKIVPVFARRWAYQSGLRKTFTPPQGKTSSGDLHRLQPISTLFGYDRGGPVDRYYIEQFLKDNSQHIKGRVLEIGDDSYSRQFGASQIQQQDILHVDDKNPAATVIGDLSNAPQIADNSYDCIVLTQTLHLIYDFHSAIETCHRILKPGGSLLLTVPGITPIDHGTWKDTWYWSFTEIAIKRLLAEKFDAEKTSTYIHGNVYIATAFLYGLGITDVKKTELDFNDPHFPVIITARAEK